jgi:hypothetical protein
VEPTYAQKLQPDCMSGLVAIDYLEAQGLLEVRGYKTRVI